MIEKEVLAEKEFILQEFQKFGLTPEIQIVAIEPADDRNSTGGGPGHQLGPDRPLLL